LKTDERTFSDYVAMLRRRRGVAAAIGLPIFLGFVVTAFVLPAVYEANAVVQIQRPQIPESMVRTTVAAYAEEMLASVTQQVLATSNVIGIIERFNLYPDKRGATAMDDLAAEFKENAIVVPSVASAASPYGRNTEVTYAFTVGFRSDDPQVAADVANELAKLHTEANNAMRAARAAKTSAFLNEEAEKVQQQIAEVEAKIANLAGGSGGALAQNPMIAAQRFEQMDRELAQIDQSLRSARERRDLIETELSQTPRYRATLSTGQAMVGGTDRLAAAQQELVALQAKYSPEHPDVLRLKREIATLSSGSSDNSALAMELRAALRASEQELATARQAYSEDHPDVVRLTRTVDTLRQQLADAERRSTAAAGSLPPADNPVFLSLSTRLRSADQEIADLSNRRAQIYSRIGRFMSSPDVEAKYNSLMQEREVLKEEHGQLREKLSQASLAQAVEAEQEGQVLVLIDPARAPTFPVEPNRAMLILLGAILGLFGAFGSASLADATDVRVRGTRDLEALLGMTPMAAIPYIDGGGEAKRRTATHMVIALAVTAACAALLIMLLSR